MKPLMIKEIVHATGGEYTGKNHEKQIKEVSTDSRTIIAESLFVPIIGPNFDGHDFIGNAIKKGAAAALCNKSKKEKLEGLLFDDIIFVENTSTALLELASYYRSLFSIPFVAVTGSVGKTTTKEMIAEILMTRYNVLKSRGNFNNEIGLPLTIFCLEQKHEAGVVELGMSALGEISRMANVVKPHIAVITNIGVTHIEHLGSKENIARAKLEILEPLKKDDIAILNGDCAELWNARKNIVPKTVFFGEKRGDVLIDEIKNLGPNELELTISGKYGEAKFKLPLSGKHNAINAVAAVAVGFEMGFTKEEIQQGLSNLKLPGMRQEFKKSKFGSDIIDDAYNANPDSMKAALDLIKELAPYKMKAVILGDMLELGPLAKKAHFEVGTYAALCSDICVFIGSYADALKEGAIASGFNPARIYTFPTVQESVQEIEKLVKDCDIILVKASRGMKFEQITQKLVGGL